MSGTHLVARRLREIGTRPAFQSAAAPYLIVDRELVIRAVNPAYLKATLRWEEELPDRFLFDAFPDNPDDPTADGVAMLGASLERVLRGGRRDRMRLQRYDIPHPRGHARFVEKVWLPVNSPIIDDGRVVGVLHHVEDVTELGVLLHRGEVSAGQEFEPVKVRASGATVDAVDDADERGAEEDAELLLRLARALKDAREAHRVAQHDVEMLHVALHSNRDIGTAIGILMHRHKIEREAAFDLLRAASQRSNRKIRDLALVVIETGTLG